MKVSAGVIRWCSILIILVVVASVSFAVGAQATRLFIDGKLISSRLINIQGVHYVPVSDLSTAYNLTVNRQGNDLLLVSQKSSVPSNSSTVVITPQNQPSNNADMMKDAKAALEGIEALESATKSGVTKAEYGRRRADAQIAVDKFINEYGESNKFAQQLKLVMINHDIASMIWDEYFKGDNTNNFIPADNPVIAYVLDNNPDLKSQVTLILGREYLYLDYGLSYYWGKASAATAQARSVYSTYK